MYRNLPTCSLLLSATLLIAADPVWVSKDLTDWTEKDAVQVLTSSPWVKQASTGVLAGLSPSQRRDGGDMNAEGGGRDGLGFDPSLIGSIPHLMTGLGAGPTKKAPPTAPTIQVRWESALPIRTAEIKAKEEGPPEIDSSEDYAIAVYDVPLKIARLELKGIEGMLKKGALLKVEGRKDIHPARVAVMEIGSEAATMIYFFPRTARLSLNDKRIEFDAQIGRVVVAQYFYPAEMTLHGKLEL